MQDRHNIIPFTMALLLHVLVFGSMFAAFDWSRNIQSITPMAITATLVTESAVVIEPPPVQRQPEPEPIVEPEPVQPDPAEQERVRLEEEARLEEARLEQQRIEREREAERRRQAELEAQRRAEEERLLEDQRRLADEERERQIEEQRLRNLQLLREEEERLAAEARQAELQAEADRLEAMNSTEMQQYLGRLKLHLESAWRVPTVAPDNVRCVVNIRQAVNGEVISVRPIAAQCNADPIVLRSIQAAVERASPLPLPDNPVLFMREFNFEFVRSE